MRLSIAPIGLVQFTVSVTLHWAVFHRTSKVLLQPASKMTPPKTWYLNVEDSAIYLITGDVTTPMRRSGSDIGSVLDVRVHEDSKLKVDLCFFSTLALFHKLSQY